MVRRIARWSSFRLGDLNDEVLERIYIGHHFKDDTEWLETLFELYTKMTAKSDPLDLVTLPMP